MNVFTTEQELRTTIPCGLPQRFKHLIAATDMISEDDNLTSELVKSWLLQKGQRMKSRTADSTEGNATLLSTRASNCVCQLISTCTYCSQHGNLRAATWTKYPHLKPGQMELILKSKSDASNAADVHICLPATAPLSYFLHSSWVIGFEKTAYTAYNKAVFFKMEKLSPIDCGMGDLSRI